MSFHFDVKKTVQVVGYLLKKSPGNTMDMRKLMTLLYIADRKSLQKVGYPITGDEPYAMDDKWPEDLENEN